MICWPVAVPISSSITGQLVHALKNKGKIPMKMAGGGSDLQREQAQLIQEITKRKSVFSSRVSLALFSAAHFPVHAEADQSLHPHCAQGRLWALHMATWGCLHSVLAGAESPWSHGRLAALVAAGSVSLCGGSMWCMRMHQALTMASGTSLTSTR